MKYTVLYTVRAELLYLIFYLLPHFIFKVFHGASTSELEQLVSSQEDIIKNLERFRVLEMLVRLLA